MGRQPAEKQRFRLSDGLCMEDASHSIARFDARVKDGHVQQSVSPSPSPLRGDIITVLTDSA